MSVKTLCPSCEEYIIFKKQPEIDDKVRCPHCHADLVVIDLEPIELDWDDLDDSWDDDDWDDDDFSEDDD
ncbi:MAG: hypothetical protein JW981_04775 [Anaerolineae bacterium]|nr:hypothetical protein [Anaerolineae bacterium]